MLNVSKLKEMYSPYKYYSRHLAYNIPQQYNDKLKVVNALCPFHNDKRAGSLAINFKTGAFKCFSCGAQGGDIIDFHTQKYNVSFVEAVNQLGREIGCLS